MHKSQLPTDVILTASTDVQDNYLCVAYQVFNGLPEVIYLVNRLFQWTRSGLSVETNLVYTEVVTGQLRLTKACLAVPEQVKVESPDVPYLTPVMPGETFAENVSLELPLKPYHPYNQVKATHEIHTIDKVVWVIGWFPQRGVEVRSSNPLEGVTLFSADYRPVMRAQQVLMVVLPVPVATNIQF